VPRLISGQGGSVSGTPHLISSASRMLTTKSASIVLASPRGSTYGTEYDSPLRSLRPYWTAFLNSLQAIELPTVISGVVSFPASSSTLSTNC